MNYNLPEILNKAAKTLGFDQAAMARAMGCTQGGYSQIINGTTKNPNILLFAYLIKNTNISPSFLLTGKGPVLCDDSDKNDPEEINRLRQKLHDLKIKLEAYQEIIRLKQK